MAAPDGYKALGKIGISYKGEYASNTAYERLDAVAHNGSTYLAIKDAPDGAPRDDKLNWIYLAKGFSGDIGDSEIAFTEAENRENINTGESVKTVFGKIKKFFADLTAPAFAQMITSKDDLLATKVTGYVPDAKAVADTYTELNGKLTKFDNYGNDINMGKLLSLNDDYVLNLFKNAPINYSPTTGQLDIGGPIVAYIMQKHSDKYGGAVIVFGYNNLRPIYYHIVNDTIDAEYYL